MDSKRLYKTDEGSVIGGVCKGFAEVYDWDVSIVRLVTLVLLFAAGMPLVIYLIMWIVLPDKKDVITEGYVDPKDDYTVESNDDDYYY